MVFNFKNKNVMIILLLTLVVSSVLCYATMENNVEGFLNGSDKELSFTNLLAPSSSNRFYNRYYVT